MFGISDSSGDDDVVPGSGMPPGVSQEDIDLFKQAQDNAQEQLNQVGDTLLMADVLISS